LCRIEGRGVRVLSKIFFSNVTIAKIFKLKAMGNIHERYSGVTETLKALR